MLRSYLIKICLLIVIILLSIYFTAHIPYKLNEGFAIFDKIINPIKRTFRLKHDNIRKYASHKINVINNSL